MTDKALQDLIKTYQRARDELVQTVLNARGVGTRVYANTVLKQVESILDRLQRKTDAYATEQIPVAYQKALEQARAFYKNHLQMRDPWFAAVHEDAMSLLAREMQIQITQGLAQVGRRIQRQIAPMQDELLRQMGLRATAEKIASGATIAQMRRQMLDALQGEGLLSVQYGEGPNAYRVSLDAYASMVARSTTREAGNTARINAAEEHGQDLVLMSKHYPTCIDCAPLQGRVYSVSGQDKRFPCLYELPGFRDGYKNIHPNCRHVILPTVEALWKDEERSRYLKDGARPLTGEVRSGREIDLYNHQQAQNRRAREEMHQYERYKAVLGEDAPKNLSAFRRIRHKGGERWQLMQLDYKRRNALTQDPTSALPNAGQATIDSRKFTGYLFDPQNAQGWAKGVAFTSRLGYNIHNWTLLQDELLQKAGLYPATLRKTTQFGNEYEQRIVVYGQKGTPANTVVGWYVNGEQTWLTTLYVKEVD